MGRQGGLLGLKGVGILMECCNISYIFRVAYDADSSLDLWWSDRGYGEPYESQKMADQSLSGSQRQLHQFSLE